MEAEIQELLNAFGGLREKADVNACFGEPVTVEGRTIIPVAQVAYGFGMGLGQGTSGEQEGDEQPRGGAGGGGGGLKARPLATIEVTQEGTRVESIIDRQKVELARTLLVGWTLFWLAWALTHIFGQRD